MNNSIEIHRDHRTEPPRWNMYWLPKLSRRREKELKKQALRRTRPTDFVRNSGRKWHTRDVRLRGLDRRLWGGQMRWLVTSSALIAS